MDSNVWLTGKIGDVSALVPVVTAAISLITFFPTTINLRAIVIQ